MHRALSLGLTVGILLSAVTGCATHTVPALAPAVSPATVQAEPEAYQGQQVKLGGVITAVHPRPDGTDIEIAGRRLDAQGRPEAGEEATGRFVVRSTESLDTATYAPGRAITAVGQVAPMESWWDEGDGAYRYPVLTYAQLLLWPPNTTTGGAYVGQRYWVWPYSFWQGPPPYVPRVTTW